MALLVKKNRAAYSKTNRSIAYLYRPQTINPAKIFVLYDWQEWKSECVRPIGLVDQTPFLTRDMTEAEKLESDASKYLIHKVYGDWDEIMLREAVAMPSIKFLNQLSYYQKNFKLDGEAITNARAV